MSKITLKAAKKYPVMFSLVSLFFFFISLQPAFCEKGKEMKIGYIDLNRVAGSSKTAKQMMESFKSEGIKRQVEIDKWKKKVEALESDLLKQGMLLSDDVRKKKEVELRKEKRNLERFFKDSTEEFERKKVASEQELLKEIVKTTKDVGNEEGYTMILSKQFLLYASEGIDLTEQVIKKIDGNKTK